MNNLDNIIIWANSGGYKLHYFYKKLLDRYTYSQIFIILVYLIT